MNKSTVALLKEKISEKLKLIPGPKEIMGISYFESTTENCLKWVVTVCHFDGFGRVANTTQIKGKANPETLSVSFNSWE